MQLHGIGALVTGASRGLGAALARELAKEGARVVMVARGKAELDRVAASISASGGVARALAADVGDKDAAYAIAGSAAALVGPIDLAIHNASVLGPVPLRSAACSTPTAKPSRRPSPSTSSARCASPRRCAAR